MHIDFLHNYGRFINDSLVVVDGQISLDQWYDTPSLPYNNITITSSTMRENSFFFTQNLIFDAKPWKNFTAKVIIYDKIVYFQNEHQKTNENRISCMPLCSCFAKLVKVVCQHWAKFLPLYSKIRLRSKKLYPLKSKTKNAASVAKQRTWRAVNICILSDNKGPCYIHQRRGDPYVSDFNSALKVAQC